MGKEDSILHKAGHYTTEFYVTVAWLIALSFFGKAEWPIVVSGSAVICMYLYSRTKIKTPPPAVQNVEPVKTDVGAILPNAKSVTIQR